MSRELLAVKGLVKHFPLSGRREYVRAVDTVDLVVKERETLGLVGESGCGKTTLGRLMVRLLEPTSGQIFFGGTDLSSYSTQAMRPLRAKMQVIFQDPFSSLNPRMNVQAHLERPMRIHRKGTTQSRLKRVEELLESVGLLAEHRLRFPHEFSGGQRQRIAIARALSVDPDFIVLDEPTSALDVSVQAQVLNLLKRLKQDRALTYVFISHDLSAVRHMSDRIAVMYLGEVVELTDQNRLFNNPLHPYTKALMSAVPTPKLKKRNERIKLFGDVPSPMRIPEGCRFHTRCPLAAARCRQEVPLLRELATQGASHLVRCHLVEGEP